VYQYNYHRNKQSNYKSSKIYKRIFLWVFLFLFVFFAIYSIDLLIHNKKIYPNVIALHQDIGNQSTTDVKSNLTEITKIMLSNPVAITHNNFEKNIIPQSDIGACINIEKLIEEAYSIGRSGSFLQRIKERLYLIRQKQIIPDQRYLSFDQKLLADFFTQLQAEIEQPKKDAFLETNRIVPAEIGIKIKKDDLYNGIKRSIIDSLDINSPVQVYLPVDYINPEITTEVLLAEIGINKVISVFDTTLQGKEENTLFNIKKASDEINGLILKPGENFLFNQLVGPAEKEDGYKESTIISNGQFTSGYGGGICQVSTTVYNAALLANLQIIERYNHSIYGDATNYVPLGRDSAVFYGYKDLRFKNSLDQTIALFCEIRKDSLLATIYGEKSLNKEIKIITMDKKVHDFDIIEIKRETMGSQESNVLQEGIPGYSIKSYRVVNDSNGENMEFLANDTYISVPRRILVD